MVNTNRALEIYQNCYTINYINYINILSKPITLNGKIIIIDKKSTFWDINANNKIKFNIIILWWEKLHRFYSIFCYKYYITLPLSWTLSPSQNYFLTPSFRFLWCWVFHSINYRYIYLYTIQNIFNLLIIHFQNEHPLPKISRNRIPQRQTLQLRKTTLHGREKLTTYQQSNPDSQAIEPPTPEHHPSDSGQQTTNLGAAAVEGAIRSFEKKKLLVRAGQIWSQLRDDEHENGT